MELRRLFPIVVTPDDHEVEDNYTNLISQVDTEPDQDPKVFAKRRAAAYQAYYEFMPLRDASHPQGPGMQLYRGSSTAWARRRAPGTCSRSRC